MRARPHAFGLLLAIAASCSSPPAQRTGASPTAAAPAPEPGDASTPLLPRPRMLRWVPADTAYFFGVLTPPAADHVEREYIARLAAYEQVLPAVERLRRARPSEMKRLSFLMRLELSLLAELGGTATREKLAGVGLDPVTVYAFYAIGMVPVVRIQLSDPARFSAVLARVAARLQIQRAALAGQTYYGAREDALYWVLAMVDGDLVAAMIPPDQRAAVLPAVLGQRAPARSMATDRGLDRLAASYGLSPSGLGYVSMVSLAAAVGGALPAPCRDELTAMAGAVPRVVLGTTAATGQEMRLHSVVEMRSDLSAALRDLRGEVPRAEPTSSAAAAIEIAAALDVGALVGGLGSTLDRIRARPFRCAALGWLNDLARTQGKTLRQTGRALVGVRGASLAVRNIDGLTSGGADLFFLFGTDRPGDLLDRLASSMGARRPGLEPGDPPVELKLPIGALLGAVHGAIGRRAVGLSIGAEARELTEMLSADVVDDPPLFFMRIDPKVVAQLRALVVGNQPSADPRMASIDADLARKLADIDASANDRFAELSMIVRATQRGLEIDFAGRYAR